MEDKEILRAIVQADRTARESVDAAVRREKLLSGSGAQIDAAAEKKAMDAARQQTDRLRAEAEAAVQKRRETLDRERAQALAALDREFEEKKADCIERIFRMAVDVS